MRAAGEAACTEFLKIVKNPSNGGKYRIGREKLLEKYGKLFSVTRRVILRYLRRLKRFFAMSIAEGIYISARMHIMQRRIAEKQIQNCSGSM